LQSLTVIELRQRKSLMILFVVVAVLSATMTMATALSVTDFLQLIFPSVGGGGSFVVHDGNPVMKLIDRVYVYLAQYPTTRALLLYSLLLIVLYGMKNLFGYLSAVLFARIKTGVLYDVRNRLHRRVLTSRFAEWSSQKQGQWLSRMSNDVAEYEANVLDSVQQVITATLTMVIYVFMLLYLDWSLTLMVVAVMSVGALLLSVSRRLKRQSRQLQELNGELMATTQETIDSLKEIKAATAIDYVNERQCEQNERYTRRRVSIYRRIYAASPISDFVGNAIVVAILFVGAMRVLGDTPTMTPALFVSYVMIYVLLLSPIKDLSNAIAQFKKGRGVEQRLAEEDSPAELVVPQRSDDGVEEELRTLELRNVSFSYGRNKVIDNLSMSIVVGSHTAITGASGSGKTTLGRLLVGLLEPDEGEILFNGKAVGAEERSRRVAYIPQQAMLFNDSVANNVRFGRELGDAAVDKALDIAQCGSLMETLEEGRDTVVGDGGGRLSGGEAQRVSIARALAGDPQIVVMDEATAALDAATERHFTESMRESMKGRTVIVVAHRASTIAACDYIYHL